MSYTIPARVPKPGLYYHYKHNPDGPINNYAYEILGIIFHTEENARPGEEHFVSYRPLYEAAVYQAAKKLGIDCFDGRPLGMWLSEVEKNGEKIPRFTKITDPAVIAELLKIRERMYE